MGSGGTIWPSGSTAAFGSRTRARGARARRSTWPGPPGESGSKARTVCPRARQAACTTSARLRQRCSHWRKLRGGMFDLRYHVASLAAVFLALAVGILLGVAISGKVSEVGERAERDRLSNLEQDVGEANER